MRATGSKTTQPGLKMPPPVIESPHFHLAMVTAERRIGEAVSRETRYFLSSLPPDAVVLARAVRGHWGIENQVHWVLDVAFRER